ncbi:hypothetical protein CMV_005663 [Castanea mollissima]|uniref:Uncharacterized protein n=1 Tax=Castanea mollissima TaxID=60419 RepID=A0A8J4VU52_9ROSI|nr:hypothetical protein CMV_005663 [Castanea mollissima]
MGEEEKKPEEKKMEEKKPEEGKKEEKKAEEKPAEEKKAEEAKDGKEAKEETPPPPPLHLKKLCSKFTCIVKVVPARFDAASKALKVLRML